MIFRYWLEPSRLWYKPWKWRIYEWHAYKGSYWSNADRQEIATAIHAKTGRYILQLFDSKAEAEKFMKSIKAK